MKKSLSIIILLFILSCFNDGCMVSEAPVACFEVSDTDVAAGEAVYFTSCSYNYDYIEWDFDDGSYSNEENPVHAFAEPGDYVVLLYVENEFDSNYVEQTIHVH